MEQLLHYVWRHRLIPAALTTTDNRAVEIIDPGLPNNGAGPDFFNAKVKIDGTLWVGNVEIHDRSTDWEVHGHHRDRAYDNVVLHVAGDVDCDVIDSQGRSIPQIRLEVPRHVLENYAELSHEDRYPPCRRIIKSLPRLTVHSWMAALQTERLERKTADIRRRAELRGGDWEDACFITLARNYGFGVNGDAFEQWACRVPLAAVAHHRDDLFQIEAIFMGQAGLLDPMSIPERYRAQALADDYYKRLCTEYTYLSHKFNLSPMDYKQWKFLRLRPQNFPHIRISQLANLYHGRRMGLRALTECDTVDALRDMMRTHVTPYWETHYTFASESFKNEKQMSPFSLNLLLINTAIPMIFAYGRHTSDERLCERAGDMLDSLKPEGNHIIRMWRECGLDVRSASDTQALIQLKNEYCDRKDCLRCRFGYEYLKRGKEPLPTSPRGGEVKSEDYQQVFPENSEPSESSDNSDNS
ncbi:MAG: DUF2851 family protein [Prevotella sp.]|nr:DUF2851 family protein [Prevotella sp.]